jgi:hypothetical protein
MSSASSVSLGALRRVKSDIESISIEASHIAVYRFDTAMTKASEVNVSMSDINIFSSGSDLV